MFQLDRRGPVRRPSRCTRLFWSPSVIYSPLLWLYVIYTVAQKVSHQCFIIITASDIGEIISLKHSAANLHAIKLSLKIRPHHMFHYLRNNNVSVTNIIVRKSSERLECVGFLPARRYMLARVFATATCPSVRLSVCPSVRHTPVLWLADRAKAGSWNVHLW